MKCGLDKERDFVNYLSFHDITAVRVCGSGAGTRKPRPDILASDKVNIYAIELKSSSNDYIFIDKRQIINLIHFSNDFGAVPVVVVKFSYLPYVFMSVHDLNITKKGNYKITRSEAANFKNKLILS